MAENTNTLPLHAEDVIFKKPSLKEFIRLIKNGTVYEIWPSTQEEFNWWNGVNNHANDTPGYQAYLNPDRGLTVENLKLKSVKTSITIFYGDNQDSIASSNIDLTKTQSSFDVLKTKVETNNGKDPLGEQEKIIKNNYFSTLEELNYPALILNTVTGAINKDAIINYEQTVKSEYLKNKTRWEKLKNLIENFKPSNVNTTYTIEDEQNISDKYYKYFSNIDNGINLDSYIKGLKDIQYDSSELKEDYELIQVQGNNQYFYPENIFNVISSFKNKIEVTELDGDEKLIYTDGINKILSNRGEDVIPTEELNAAATTLHTQASTLYNYLYGTQQENNFSGLREKFTTIKNNSSSDHDSLFYSITSHQFEKISENNQTYEQLQEIIESYKIFYKNILILNKKGGQILDEDLILYKNVLADIEAQQELILPNKSNASEILINQINAINNYITSINDITAGIKNGSHKTDIANAINNYTIPYLQYSYFPVGISGLTGAAGAINNIDIFASIAIAETQISEVYGIGDSANIKMTSTEYQTCMDEIFNIAYDQLLGTDEERAQENFVPKLKLAYDQIFDDLMIFIRKYESCLDKIAERGFTCIVPSISSFEVDTATGLLKNKQKLLDDLYLQYTKSQDYFNIVKTIVPGVNQEVLTKINDDYTDLERRISNIVITKTQFADSNYFDNWVEQNFNADEIITLIVRLVNKDSDASKYIPTPTANYLDIDNKAALLAEYKAIEDEYLQINRFGKLEKIIQEINNLVSAWVPSYDSTGIKHYVCINVGSFIQFANESNTSPYDGSISISVDEVPHYPLVNGLTSEVTSNTRGTEIATVQGLKSIFGENFNKIGTTNVGGAYQPVYIKDGNFITANVISAKYETLKDGSSAGWRIVDTTGNNNVSVQAVKVFGAVYNDYAEYRAAEAEPGRCIIENGDGTLSLSTGRLQLGANIVSDTYGFAIGETNDATCPIAVCGRVLAYPLESKELFTPGTAVCSGPEGTISLMTREEIREWPDAIVGYVSEVPAYDTWGTDNVPVNGRIWIKIK